MYGYIMVNKPELKIREFETYRAYYCGLCRSLGRRHGNLGKMTLTYDMTFLAILLTGVYEPRTYRGAGRCVLHPLKKHPVIVNTFSDYAADMNVLLFYEKCRDDWRDERRPDRAALAGLLRGAGERIRRKYPEKTERIREKLEAIYRAEEENELDIDKMSGYYGEVMSEIFAWQPDIWERTLRRTGFYLGKFVYILDAFEDVEEDLKKGNYNPLKRKYSEDPEGFEEYCRRIMTMMMAECCSAFERLPIVKDAEILRNILYSGVWLRCNQAADRRKERREKKNERSV